MRYTSKKTLKSKTCQTSQLIFIVLLVISFLESLIFICFPCKKLFPILVPVQLLLPQHAPCQSLSLYSSSQLGCRLFVAGCVTYTRVFNSWYMCKALDLSLLNKLLKETERQVATVIYLFDCQQQRNQSAKLGPIATCLCKWEREWRNSPQFYFKLQLLWSLLSRDQCNFLFNSFQKRQGSFLILDNTKTPTYYFSGKAVTWHRQIISRIICAITFPQILPYSVAKDVGQCKKKSRLTSADFPCSLYR